MRQSRQGFIGAMLGIIAGATTVLVPLPAESHQFRTAYVGIVQADDRSFRISWRRPAEDVDRISTELVASPGCELSPGAVVTLNGFRSEDYELACAGDPANPWLELRGLEHAPYDALAKFVDQAGQEHYQHLHGERRRVHLLAVATSPSEHANLFREGVFHMLGGYDHLAYMLLLYFFLRQNWKSLLLGVTTFTIAHSTTLALSALEVIQLPARPVEAVIALTICYFATALVRGQRPEPGLFWRWQLLVFACGLVHGLGFANSLSGVGLEHRDLLWALVTFNLGLEAAQLLFMVVAASTYRAIVAVPRRFTKMQAERWVAVFIGAFGAMWYFQRVMWWFV